MFFPSNFYTFKENKNSLEFREKRTILYFESPTLIVMGFLFFQSITEITTDQYYDIQSTLTLLLFLIISIALIITGIVDLVISGKIILDKKKKTLSFIGGKRKLLLTPKIVPFSQISHIQIKEEARGSHGITLLWDIIIIKTKDGEEIQIDYSRNEEYTNMICRKISSLAECDCYFDSL